MSNRLLGAITAVGVVASAAVVVAQDKLSKGDQKWMEEEVGAIITAQEVEMFQKIDKDDRKLFKELFWMRRDYDPATKDNEYKKGFDERVDIADDEFRTRGRKGSQSDMGKVFLLMGAPDDQQPGGSAGEGGLPVIPDAPESDRSDQQRPAPVPSSGGSIDTMLWVYNPNASLGIPDGLALEFRRRDQFGYRLANDDDVEPHLERVKERMIANRAIAYSLDAEGRLRELDDKFDPNSPAKTILSALRNTGETSSGIEFEASPSFFQAANDEIFVPIDFTITGGPTSDNVTFFYAVEDVDGFDRNPVEESATLTKDGAGRWRYEYPIQLEPGQYTMYVGFLDGNAEVHGTQIIDLAVPELEGDALDLSSIVMFTSADQTNEIHGVPGQAFMLGGYHFKPKGSRVYTHSEQLSGVFNAYNYGLENDQPNLTVQVEFFKDGEKRGQTEDAPFMAQAASMALTVFDIPLNIPNFKETGAYTIEVTVTDHVNNQKKTEEIAFVIE